MGQSQTGCSPIFPLLRLIQAKWLLTTDTSVVSIFSYKRWQEKQTGFPKMCNYSFKNVFDFYSRKRKMRHCFSRDLNWTIYVF